MNFNKTIQALVNYDSVYVTAVKAWREARDSIIKDYAGENKANRLTDAKTLLDNTLAKAKADTLEAVKADFEAARTAVNAVVTKPVPADFSGDIEAIKAMGDILTANELMIYLDKYKNSYTATRAIAKIGMNAGYHDVRFMVVSVDKVLELLRETEAMTLDEVQNKNSVALSYIYRVLISNVENNPLVILSGALTRLESGDFSDFEVFPTVNMRKNEGAYNTFVPRNNGKNEDNQQNGDDNQQGGNEGEQ